MIVRATDVYGEPLPAAADISIEPAGSPRSARRIAKDTAPGTRVHFEAAPTETYLVRIRAAGHSHVAKLISGTTAQIEIAVPISKDAAIECEWPEPLPEIPGVTAPPWSEPLSTWNGLEFDELTDSQRQAVLNIWAKLWMTHLGAAPAATYIEQVLEVEADRLLCRIAGEMAELVETDPGFDSAPGALHQPPPGYARGISGKTKDRYANLQITVFIGAEDTLADIDIDENRRTLAHLFDVIEHAVTDTKTSQLEIHQILIAQNIDPGWRPRLA